MAEDSGQERTEQATTKRREEARKRGQVARSPELNSALMLLAGFATLMIFRGYFMNGITSVMKHILSQCHTYHLDAIEAHRLALEMLRQFGFILLPLFAVLFVMGILVNVIQVGFNITAEPITPKLSKINPIEGFKRVFSRRSLESLIRDILKIIIVGWIAYSVVKSVLMSTIGVADATIAQIISYTGLTIFSIAMKILIGYIIIAILDYGFQRWDFEKSIMMTKQEVREEMKQTDGDPLVRSRLRAIHRQLARQRMMEEVPKATVVVTNPTEIAVALMYKTGMPAPLVVAKGRRIIAEKIREIAIESGIPIVQNILLARTLYKSVDIGKPIPADLYTAVAEVLAYVYRLKGKKII